MAVNVLTQLSVMSDIFHVDYSENLNMHPSVPKGAKRNVVCS